MLKNPCLRFIFKGFKILFFLALLVFLGTLCAALAILIWPQILVNSRTLELARQYAYRKGVEIQWRTFDLRFHSFSLLSKEVLLDSEGLCISIPKSRISGCSSKISMTIGADFSRLKLKWTQVGPLQVQDLKWDILDPSGARVSGVLNLQAESKRRPSDWRVQVQGRACLPDRSRIEANATLNLVHVPEFLGIRMKQSVRRMGIHYNVTAHYGRDRMQAQVQGSGFINFNEINGNFSGVGTRLAPTLPRLQFENCQIALRRNVGAELVRSGGFLWGSCPIEIQAPLPPPGIALFHLPSEIKSHWVARLATSHFPPTPDSRFKGNVVVQLAPGGTSLFHAEGRAEIDLDLVPKEFPRSGTANVDIHLAALLPDFQRLVFTLDRSDWAIPAPFHALNGKAMIECGGQGDLASGHIDLKARTHLFSKAQKVNLNGTGTFYFNRDLRNEQKGRTPVFLDFEVILTDVQLELPRLDLGPPPRFFPDSRFVSHNASSNEEAKHKRSFPLRGRIRTLAGHPAKLLSNLAHAPVPVQVDITFETDSPLAGTIQVGNFPTQLFTREAQIVNFSLELQNPTSKSQIDGSAKIVYTDYTVFLHVLGTVDQPKLVLRSDPPLPENQLWAVLLFGHPLDELDPEQSASIGNTQSAIADGAIGLASLYLLASTPVESVSYDPGTNTFSAKIRLGEGISLNLGRSGPESSVGIRKRLGPFLALETGLSTSSQGGEVGTIYLEWSRRY